MKPPIEVYVHSVSPDVDYELAREMSQHGFCHPQMASRAGEIFLQFNKVKGRVFSEEDWAVLQRLAEVAGRINEVRLYDVSRIADRLKALSRGIIKTPVIIINGEKNQGAEECLDAVNAHCK
jgi:hypothetical protein